MKIREKERFARRLTTATRTVVALILMMGILSAAGCAAVVGKSEAPAAGADDVASNTCTRLLESDRTVTRQSKESSVCRPEFPENTIYRDQEARLMSARPVQISNRSQIDLFTPFWLLF